MSDSGRWKEGEREASIEGVRRRIEGLEEDGVFCRRGRNDCVVRMGVRRRMLRRSERVVGERVAIGVEG